MKISNPDSVGVDETYQAVSGIKEQKFVELDPNLCLYQSRDIESNKDKQSLPDTRAVRCLLLIH